MAEVFVMFEVTVKKGKMADYLERAEQLKAFLQEQPGFVRAERFASLATEGKLLSLSVWRDEESVAQWRNLVPHRQSQQAGREEDFEGYVITVAAPMRRYSRNERKEAPQDSNRYFDLED